MIDDVFRTTYRGRFVDTDDREEDASPPTVEAMTQLAKDWLAADTCIVAVEALPPLIGPVTTCIPLVPVGARVAYTLRDSHEIACGLVLESYDEYVVVRDDRTRHIRSVLLQSCHHVTPPGER